MNPNFIEAIAAEMNAICDAQPFTTSWYVKNLTTGESAARAGSVPVPSGSTRKIAYLMAALRAARAGRIDLDERVVVEERLMQGVVSGVLYFMTPGLTFPISSRAERTQRALRIVCQRRPVPVLLQNTVDATNAALQTPGCSLSDPAPASATVAASPL